MITFTYTARNNKTNELVKAEVQAENEQAAAKLLISRGLFPIKVEELNKKGFEITIGTGVRSKDRLIFTRQLSTLINAGLPLTQSLRTVRDQLSNKKLQTIVDSIVTAVEGGSTLHDAFAKHPKIFNQIYISLVAAGEASGTLDKALDRIATQQEKDAAIVSKIRGAMIYPAIVLLVVLGVLVFMLTTVLPQIGGLFKDLKKTLPLQTRLLLALSSFTTTYWYVVLLFLIGLAFGVRTYIRTVDGRAHLDQLKLKMPLFGKLFHKTYMARFCRTVGTLVGTGVPMLEALSISQQAISNVHIADSIGTAIGKVRGGKSLSSSLEGDSNFMILVPQMIKIGEESGALDEMMGRAAVFYENEVDEEVKNLSTTIEPVLMVVLGLIVAGVILTVLLPVYGLVGGGLQ
jgi:type IV pilus assembly protein PilC